MDWDSFEEKVSNCRKCRLGDKRQNAVPGSGDHEAEVLFIGEAPGSQEDKEGKPFVGRAGGILDDLLESVDLKREEVYIANILKCRPPQNRDPKKEEIEACTPYLDKQIKAIKPKIICTLGNFATKYILDKYNLDVKSIGKVHGQVFKVSNLILSARILPIYHPAVVTYNPNMKETLEEDFKVLQELMES